MTVPTAAGWIVRRFRGSAGDQHGLDVLAGDVRRELHLVEVTAPAIVLGSAQSEDSLDRAVCERLGLEVVRRRSGGGAVLLVPDEHVWIDVLIPRDDPRFAPDVSESNRWLGEAWVEALDSLGVAARLHAGAPVEPGAARRVCFAGVVAGEVVDERGAKLVGISQRRTRRGARLQCTVHRRWRPETYAELLPGENAGALAGRAGVVPVGRADLEDALALALSRR